jgi:hypothetical protein
MRTKNTFEIHASKGSPVCKNCGSCRCTNGGRWKRTASQFTDPETAGLLEAALASSWPPEEFPVSIEVLGDQGREYFVVEIHGQGINTQEIVATEHYRSWPSDRVIAVILERTQRIVQRLKEEGRLS